MRKLFSTSVRLAVEQIERLNTMEAYRRGQGDRKANRSKLVREALDKHFDDFNDDGSPKNADPS